MAPSDRFSRLHRPRRKGDDEYRPKGDRGSDGGSRHVGAGAVNAQDGPVGTSDQREATIVLHVVNLAAISREVLNQVKEHVARVYEDIGVRTVWVDSEQAVGKQ